jgi:hypothetical protein
VRLPDEEEEKKGSRRVESVKNYAMFGRPMFTFFLLDFSASVIYEGFFVVLFAFCCVKLADFLVVCYG